MTVRRVAIKSLGLAAVLALGTREAGAQSAVIDPAATGSPGAAGGAPSPGMGGSSLGPAPGAGLSPFGTTPGAGEDMLGGRPGTSTPRVPASITTPGGAAAPPSPATILPPASLRAAPVPVYGSLALPGRDDEGPPDGLTLDAAIERLVRANMELLSKSYEIPQAQADILTASLRANPILYADSQLIPYGSFSPQRPGGPTQYDINITYPLDVTHKRRARIEVACRAKRVLEAQYQDAVRLQIDNLYTAYVDVLAARETVRFARASVEGLTKIQEVTQKLKEQGSRTEVDVDRVRIQRDAAEIGQADAEEAMLRAKRVLGVLLALAPAEAGMLEPRGTIHDLAPTPPAIDGLAQTALATRPDVVAFRLGVARAESDVKLAHANRFGDVYVLAQPYTFQNNAPFDKKSSHSWAAGVTVPLPLYNRNQGNIQRARLNVAQTQTELATLERAVFTEVEQAEREYAITRAAVTRIEGDLLPGALRLLRNTERLYTGGELDLVAYLTAQRDYNDVVRQYRDTLVRHRRAMLRLNTVVGQRILP